MTDGMTKAVRKGFATGFKFVEKDDKLVGYYLGTTDKVINGKPAKEHTFQTSEGTKNVLGQVDMYNQLIENGCLNKFVEIVFTGKMEKLKNGNTKKLYDVFFNLKDTYNGPSPDPYPTEEEPPYAENEEVEVAPARVTRPANPAPTPSASAAQRLLGNRSKQSA